MLLGAMGQCSALHDTHRRAGTRDDRIVILEKRKVARMMGP